MREHFYFVSKRERPLVRLPRCQAELGNEGEFPDTLKRELGNEDFPPREKIRNASRLKYHLGRIDRLKLPFMRRDLKRLRNRFNPVQHMPNRRF